MNNLDAEVISEGPGGPEGSEKPLSPEEVLRQREALKSTLENLTKITSLLKEAKAQTSLSKPIVSPGLSQHVKGPGAAAKPARTPAQQVRLAQARNANKAAKVARRANRGR